MDNYFYYPKKISILFIIAIINRLFFHFVIILESNKIGAEAAKALVKALKFKKNLINMNLCKLIQLFIHIILVI